MIYLIYMMPFLFAALFGIFDAAQTLRADWSMLTVFAKWFSGKEKLWRWYEGGNDKYNPTFEWTCDFWHFCKHMWLWMYSFTCMAVVASVLYTQLEWYCYLPYLFIGKYEGFVFSIFYKSIFRVDGMKLREVLAYMLKNWATVIHKIWMIIRTIKFNGVMKMGAKGFWILAGVLFIGVIAATLVVTRPGCNDKEAKKPVATLVKGAVKQELHQGKADSTTVIREIHKTGLKASGVLDTSSLHSDTRTPLVKHFDFADSIDGYKLHVGVDFNPETNEATWDYDLQVKELHITKTDTIFQSRVDTLQTTIKETPPWYNTFAAGASVTAIIFSIITFLLR